MSRLWLRQATLHCWQACTAQQLGLRDRILSPGFRKDTSLGSTLILTCWFTQPSWEV